MGFPLVITPTQAAADDGSGRQRGVERSQEQPRVPIIGLDSGCIPGTKPGSSAAELDRAARDIVHAELARKRLNHAARVGRMEPSSRPR